MAKKKSVPGPKSAKSGPMSVDLKVLGEKLSDGIDLEEFNDGEDAAEARALAMMMAEGVFDNIGEVRTGNGGSEMEVIDDDSDVSGSEDGGEGSNDSEAESDIEEPTTTTTTSNSEIVMETVPSPSEQRNTISRNNNNNSNNRPPLYMNNTKGLLASAAALDSRNLAWPEKFSVVPGPLDLAEKDVHDDIKREVSFYNLALAGVEKCAKLCDKYKIPFTRPLDFFAEMIKSDEHMGKVKDRLIFESKKMDAFEQRKANKDQKLRHREKQSDSIKNKAKMKKDNLADVDNWAKNAAQNRGSAGTKDDGYDNTMLEKFTGENRKRQRADEKWGHGGKKGKFKQMDKKMINDMSSFNPRGNFAGGMKSSKKTGMQKVGSGGAGAKRGGKRARDASRSAGRK